MIETVQLVRSVKIWSSIQPFYFSCPNKTKRKRHSYIYPEGKDIIYINTDNHIWRIEERESSLKRILRGLWIFVSVISFCIHKQHNHKHVLRHVFLQSPHSIILSLSLNTHTVLRLIYIWVCYSLFFLDIERFPLHQQKN